MKPSTLCVHLDPRDEPYSASSPPIYQTSTFRQESASDFGEYDYTRSGNPTRTLLEQQLAQLEHAAYACAFASGMAAITALTRLVKSGEEIIAGDDMYGGTVRLLEQIRERQGVTVTYIDTTRLDEVRAAITPQTRLLFIETPSNPLFRISDIRALATLAHEAGVLLAVDNSMLSPVLQQPLSLGADIVVHSATKFLCGHSDVTAGAVITNDSNLQKRISFQQNAEGAGLSPFESWLLIRGLKTLALRVERQTKTAGELVHFLERFTVIKEIYYPGIKNHPGHEIHRSQSEGDGSVICFTTGDDEFSKRTVEATTLFDIAVSFGSAGSTISLPCRMSHASIPLSLKERLGPPPDLVRLSVGIEDADDLIYDLNRAFSIAAAECTNTYKLI
jgi:cystathionine beta-lyase